MHVLRVVESNLQRWKCYCLVFARECASHPASLLLGIIIVYAIALCDGIRKLQHGGDPLGDFSTFRNASIALTAGKGLYGGTSNEYVYPPLIAFLYQPFAGMTLRAAGLVSMLINLVLSLATLWLVAREMAKRLLNSTDRRLVLCIAVTAALLSSDRILAEFKMWETNVVVLLMLTIALALADRLPWVAGSALGFAFNIKYLPLAFLPYLLLRRRWSMAGAFALSAVVFALLPALSLGWAANLRMLAEAFGGLAGLLKITLPHAAHVYPLTDWRTLSLPSGIARVTGWPPTSVMIIAACGGFLVAAIAALASESRGLHPFSWPSSRAQLDPQHRAMFGVEWAIVLMLALVFSPFTNAAHFYMLIMANAACAALFLSSSDGLSRLTLAAGLIAMFLGLTLPPEGQAFRTARNFSKWMGLPAYFVLLNCGTFYWSALRTYAGTRQNRATHSLAASAQPGPRTYLSRILCRLGQTLSTQNISTAVLLGIAVLVGERFVFAAFIPLIPQEAYYWMYSRHLDLGYFDHPPFVAWMVWLGTAIFGTNEFGVRIVGELLMLASAALLYQLARTLYSRATGMAAVAAFFVIPLYYHVGWLATMDSALVFFSLAAMLGFIIAVDKKDDRGWWIAGLASGLAMLSKYTGAFCLIGMFSTLLLYQPWRFYLRCKRFWLACFGAIAIFSPVVEWNYAHHWASFRFQTVERFTHPLNPWQGISVAFGGQAAVFLPLAVIAIAVIAMRVSRKAVRVHRGPRSKRLAFALAFSTPLLAVLALESFRTAVHINWAAPACLSLIAPAAQHLRLIWRLSASRPGARLARRCVLATCFACAAVAAALLPYVALVYPKHGFLAYDFGPWPALAQQVHLAEEQIERKSGREPLVVADGPFELASEIAFYRAKIADDIAQENDEEHRDRSTGKMVSVLGEAPPFKTTTSQWFFGKGPGNAFPFWLNKQDWIGCDVIYVTTYTDIPAEIRSESESVELIALPYLGGKRKYNVALCHNVHPVTLANAD